MRIVGAAGVESGPIRLIRAPDSLIGAPVWVVAGGTQSYRLWVQLLCESLGIPDQGNVLRTFRGRYREASQLTYLLTLIPGELGRNRSSNYSGSHIASR